IYDWAERKKLKSFDADSRGPFNRVVFTPDMQKVLIDSSDNTARLLEVGSGDTLRVFRAHNQFISASAISKDGANVATADILGALQLGKSAKNSNDRRLERQQGQITCVDFSPDGRRVIIAADTGEVKIRDFATGRELVSLKSSGRVFNQVLFFPDGSHFLTAAKDGASQIWILRQKRIIFELKYYFAPITAMVFSPDGSKLATGSDDRSVKLWGVALERELPTIRELATIKGHGSFISALAWSRDSRYLAVGS